LASCQRLLATLTSTLYPSPGYCPLSQQSTFTLFK
jgi:hypothetical protein